MVLVVKYSEHSDEYPQKHSLPKDRKFIWTDRKGHNVDVGTYQPEIDGYEVSYVQQGIFFILLISLLGYHFII